MKLKDIPNFVTILRIILVFPVLGALYFGYDKTAFFLFIIASISDGVDGLLARRYNCSSRFGSIADPLADKLLMVSTFLMLTYLQKIPLWLLSTIVIRDMIIIAGGLLYHYLIGAFELVPSSISKLNTVLQLLLIVLVLFQASYFLLPQQWIAILIYLVFLTNIVSLIHYVWVWSGRAIRSSQQHD